MSIAHAIDDAVGAATNVPLSRLHTSNTARAMLDPTYADIEARRHTDGSRLVTMISDEKRLGIEEWDLQDQILESVSRHPWWERPLRALSRGRLASALTRLEHASQRLNRGWDDTAVWGLDDHLAATLGAQLTALAHRAHGYPAGDRFTSLEQWQAELLRHGGALTAYATRFDKGFDSSPDFPAQYAAAQDALRWVADNLDALWD